MRHPRYHVPFTPTGASWINLVERRFAALTDKQVRRAGHRSTRELETAIVRYIEVTTERPTGSSRPWRDLVIESLTPDTRESRRIR